MGGAGNSDPTLNPSLREGLGRLRSEVAAINGFRYICYFVLFFALLDARRAVAVASFTHPQTPALGRGFAAMRRVWFFIKVYTFNLRFYYTA